MLRWNQRSNLTAITDAEGIAVKHFLDAIGPLPLIASGSQIIDLGSGAGFPGLPLKVLRPEISTTLVDSNRKKVSFLSHMIRLLGLSSIQALQARGEDLLHAPQFAGPDTLIVTRAFRDLGRLVVMTAPLLEGGGRLIAWKGPRADQELRDLKAMKLNLSRPLALYNYDYQLPLGDQRRTAVVVALAGR
jgi:16S rRNA (guanine527-N7)-methyltransferase